MQPLLAPMGGMNNVSGVASGAGLVSPVPAPLAPVHPMALLQGQGSQSQAVPSFRELPVDPRLTNQGIVTRGKVETLLPNGLRMVTTLVSRSSRAVPSPVYSSTPLPGQSLSTWA